ncbi:unnamed protein product [Prorocentrum cordatum]|uniref:PDZ domain-containing protein n=1 Tax=Prorocentrum cordatum TaxID=2364126 RepID=A0ABN9SPG5_9DINO|nr:unnamed protein product [Polarella glacialis]
MWLRAVPAALLLGECAVRSQALVSRADSNLRSGTFLDLDHVERFESRLSTEVGGTAELESQDMLGTTLSPEDRVRAHSRKFEAEFVVELNMTEANERGAKLGIIINRNADFEPATIYKVQKIGLIEEWNRAHPRKDVHVGDELVQVNDIQWHANTETFMNRIKGQFIAGRKRVAGASEILKLYIQRPRVWKHKRFALQREDAHDKKYAADFVAEIPMGDIMDDMKYAAEIVGNTTFTSIDGLMGWTLGFKRHGDWQPATIRKIERHGALAKWNKKHADQLILEGDEILKVDKVLWQHNSTTFMKNLKRHFKATLETDANNKSWSVVLAVRRPRPVQTAFDEVHPVQEIVSWSRTNTSVAFRFNRTGETNLLGWKLSPGAKSASGVEGPVLVEKVRSTGLVAEWNAENPDKTVSSSDQIVTLNGMTWDKYASAQEFYDAVQTALTAAIHAGPAGDVVQLTLERPVQSVQYHRLNMEHGVHTVYHVHATTSPAPDAAIDTAYKQVGAKDDSADATGATDEGKPVGAEEDSDGVIGATEDDDKAVGAEDDSDGVIGASEDDQATGAEEDSGGVTGASEDDP